MLKWRYFANLNHITNRFKKLDTELCNRRNIKIYILKITQLKCKEQYAV